MLYFRGTSGAVLVNVNGGFPDRTTQWVCVLSGDSSRRVDTDEGNTRSHRLGVPFLDGKWDFGH